MELVVPSLPRCFTYSPPLLIARLPLMNLRSRFPADGVPRHCDRSAAERELAGSEGPHAEGRRAHVH